MTGSRFDAIPQVLRGIDRWILWRWVRKGNNLVKVPTRPSLDGNISAFDPAAWLSFEEAVDRLNIAEINNTWGGGGGVGLTFEADQDDLGGIDLDGVLCPRTGRLAGWAREVVARFSPTFVEVSPSGCGLHVYSFGAPNRISPTSRSMPRAEGDPDIPGKPSHLEAYVTRRFFTVTGIRYCGVDVAKLPEAWTWLAGRLAEGRQVGERAAPSSPRNERLRRQYPGVDPEVVEDALRHFTSNDVSRNEFVAVGLALKAAYGEDAREIYLAWMAKSDQDDPKDTARLWDGLTDQPDSVTLGTVLHLAVRHGWAPPWRRGRAAIGKRVSDKLLQRMEARDD